MAAILLGLGVAGGVGLDRLTVEAASATTASVETPGPKLDELQAAIDRTAFRVALLEARSESSDPTGKPPSREVATIAAAVALLSLRERAASDAPFNTELALVRALLAGAPGSEAAMTPLIAYADGGVPSQSDLAFEFGRLLPLLQAQIDAQAAAGRDGRQIVQSVLARVHLAQPIAVDPRVAVLASAQMALARGRLSDAVTAIEGLDPASRTIVSGWLAAARVRLGLDRNLDALLNQALAGMASAS